MSRDIFISDLHIGIYAETNLDQTSVHEKSLQAILKYIEDEGARDPADKIRNVVILGDWLDLWMYRTDAKPIDTPRNAADAYTFIKDRKETLLPTVKQIFDANPNLFASKEPGSFISCINNIAGTMYYVNSSWQ